jgi:hypothetical protein
MWHLSTRLSVALLTFIVGTILAGAWYALRQPSIQQPEGVAQLSNENREVPNVVLAEPDCDPAFEGRYSNYDYAYSVQIPKGMVGFGSCITNHGFGIDLTNPTSRVWTELTPKGIYPKSYVYVDASYNSAEWQSFDEAFRALVMNPKDKGITDVELVTRNPTHLSRLTAMRFVVRYAKFGQPMMRDMVLAFRGRNDIMYTIDLTTPVSSYEEDKKVLSWMQRTWRLQPVL